MNYKRVSDLVEKVLTECPEARESDTLLAFKVWEIQGVIFDQYLVHKVSTTKIYPAAETVARIRREFNQKAMYLPSQDRLDKRSAASGNLLDYIHRDEKK